jgi:hypothetical protein
MMGTIAFFGYIHGNVTANSRCHRRSQSVLLFRRLSSGQEVPIAYWMYLVRVTDTEAKSYCKRDPAKVHRVGREREEMKVFGGMPRNTFVCSADGKLGRGAKTFAKRLAAKFASKWEKSYSQVCGYVNARLRSICTMLVGRTLDTARERGR